MVWALQDKVSLYKCLIPMVEVSGSRRKKQGPAGAVLSGWLTYVVVVFRPGFVCVTVGLVPGPFLVFRVAFSVCFAKRGEMFTFGKSRALSSHHERALDSHLDHLYFSM